ncbi:MAG TPA: DNA repair exonuclease [Chloroflexota bacterium]|nr:DNA repair exonuclease [Chloroflexota bacterium]
MGVRILHAADMHLGRRFPHLGERAEERRVDLLDTFGRICEEAIGREVAALLIAGDLFDTYDPPADLIGAVRARFGRLARAGVRVVVIPGNHDDYWYPRSVWRQTFDAATVFTAPRFEAVSFEAGGSDVTVHGVAYNADACADPLGEIRRWSGINIALLHATVDPPEHYPAERRYYSLSRDALRASGMDYVALGHIHRPATFKDASGVFACYPGTPEGLDSTERGDRHVALLEFDGGAPRTEMIPVNARRVERWEIDVTDCDSAAIATKMRQLGSPDLLLTATLTGAPLEIPNLDGLQSEAGDAFFTLEIDDRTEMVRSKRIEELSAENTIRGFFIRALRERIEAATAGRVPSGYPATEERATLELALKLGMIELEKESAAGRAPRGYPAA